MEVDLLNKKITAVIFIAAFVGALAFRVLEIAAIDAPHNASNNISCGSCHGAALYYSAFWGGSFTPADIDDTPYNRICLSCHTESSPGQGGYPQTKGPLVKTHSSLNTSNKYGDWTRECRNCHDPHYQRQKNYKTTDASRLYLATGTITSCVYNGNGTSTLTYSSITYKSGWDFTKLTAKTGDYRRTILFPNVNKLGYNYPIKAVNEGAKTITVTGDATVYLYPPTTFAVLYGQYIKDTMNVGGTNIAVKFFDQTDSNSYADGDAAYNGICEVCHTQTKHFRNNGGAPDQNHSKLCSGEKDRTNCMPCHNHTNGLGHGYKNNCVNCHGHDNGWNGGSYYGTTQSHSTHTENDTDDLKGPNITCGDCHDVNNFPYFKSGTDSDGDGKYSLAETDVCNNCHSPNGTYNGVSDAVIGAKNNWCQGVYQGNALKSGKEKWCAGCHDEQPANSKADGTGVNAPDVIGNETAATQYGTGYGFYKTGHGLASGSYPASGETAANIKCTDCHNTTYKHIDHISRAYKAAQRNYQAGYRLKYSMDIPRKDIGMPASDFELCGKCHDLDQFLEQTNLTTNLRSVTTSGTSTGLSETVLTDTAKGWTVNGLTTAALIPDIEKPWNVYPIISNTATTVTVSGSMLSDGALPGDNYRVEVNSHRTHLQSWQTGPWNPYAGGKWDSDYDGGGVESMISCPTCHNVHGSTLPRMTRDGNLVSGRSLGFYYVPPYSYPNSTRLPDSDGGRWSQSVCSPCHPSFGTYTRVVKGTVTFSSDADQYFSVADPPTTISTITINDNPQAGSITAANDIRIRIPEHFNMTWNTADTSADFGGTASGKVNSTVSFPDNKTLLIDVTSDFAAGDTLTISGLSFTNFSAASGQGNLELYIDGGHVLNTVDTKTILIGTKAIISSASNQTFAVGDWSTEISPITIRAITDDADINTANDIRIKIPATFPMIWNTSDTSAVISGGAAAKVSATVSYPDNRTLLINIISDFAEGDEITISGLSFTNFYDAASADNLELYVDGPFDTIADALDNKTITIESRYWMSPVDIVPPPLCWDGSKYTDLKCPDNLIDGDLTTGNCWPQQNAIFDLGRQYLVTHIRLYAGKSNWWRLYVGNNPDNPNGCLPDGIDVSGQWTIGNDGTRWYELTIPADKRTVGRYIRLQGTGMGGGAADDTLFEIEFFGIPQDGSSVTIASAADQEFEVGQAAAAISPITITESSTTPTITASNDIRIVIPSDLYMSWDTSDTVATIGGSASAKVSSTVSYPNNKTLLIDVNSNFAADDTLTIDGLSFKNFVGQSEPANLQLSIDGGNSFSTTDSKAKQIWEWISPVDVVDNYATTIVNTVNLTNTTLTIANQPYEPTYLSVIIVDKTKSITAGIVTITGTTADGPGQIDIIDCSAGAGTYSGNKVFESIDSIVTADFATLGGNGDETIAVVTLDCCDLNGAGFLIDNNTSTGNTPWTGGYALVDLGDTYTVTGIRIFSASLYYFNWDVSIGNVTPKCNVNSYGTMVKDEWYVAGDSQWHSTKIDPPVTGRYIRIDKDQGGGLDDSGLREIDFQGYKTSESKYLTISSSSDQTFEKNQSSTPIQPINIKYYPANGTITAANDIRIKIPASFNMTWDTTDTTATIGGSAASKVSSTVSYPDNKTLLINVTQDFSAGDTLIISGLSFTNFSDQSFKNHLQLSIDGGTSMAATDSKYIWVIHWQTPSVYAACTSCCGAGNVVDGNTATGNCTWGGPVVFDLGESKTVRSIRVWANNSRRWTATVGDDLTLCGTDWPSPKWNWWTSNGQWSETPVTPTDGRYLRFYIDIGGPMAANTLMEFQYQAW